MGVVVADIVSIEDKKEIIKNKVTNIESQLMEGILNCCSAVGTEIPNNVTLETYLEGLKEFLYCLHGEVENMKKLNTNLELYMENMKYTDIKAFSTTGKQSVE